MAGISQEGKHSNLTTDALRYATLVLAIVSYRGERRAGYSNIFLPVLCYP
jgi:hypothetical protein